MDKYQRRMLIRRDKIRQDQLELRGKRHREARERLMEMRATAMRGNYGIGDWDLDLDLERYRIYSVESFMRRNVWVIYPQRHPQYDVVMNELMENWRKRQSQHCCRLIKEELMMNRWHPDRVEKMLESGILEDLW
jgi:hypothetical protein